jgi:ATP-dependent Clp protease adaptor protein ClpS
MEFVISLLMSIFKHSTESSKEIMLQVHETGSGVAGIYSFEIAEGESNLPLNDLKAGFYTLRIKDYQGNITYKKYIKND